MWSGSGRRATVHLVAAAGALGTGWSFPLVPAAWWATHVSRASRRTGTTAPLRATDPNLLSGCTGLRNEYFALRHGQSEANVAGLIAADPAVACAAYGLSPVGKVQARDAGGDVVAAFGRQPFRGVCILTSDLLRAHQTAEAVADAIRAANEEEEERIPLHGGNVIVDVRLRERGFGEWDGTSDANYPEVWKDDASDPGHTLRGVESVDSVMRRATECVLEWDSRLEDHMILCVAHGDVLQILQTAFSKLDGSQHRSLEHLETATLRKLEIK